MSDPLESEFEQLTGRLDALQLLIASDEFRKLPARDRTLLTMQRSYMRAYLEVLTERLKRIYDLRGTD